jgi:lysozyme family protein
MTGFNQAFDRLILVEGGYSDKQSDAGGKTMYGITEAVARANGYTGQMPELNAEIARGIYRTQYWNPLALDKISALVPSVADEMFDTGVNTGIGVAGQFLQRALNAFNNRGKDYPDLTTDGLIGPMTIQALNVYLRKRGVEGEKVLLRALNALQGARYIDITERRAENEDFTYGWIKNRVA